MKEVWALGKHMLDRRRQDSGVWYILHMGFFSLVFVFSLLDQNSIVRCLLACMKLCVLLLFVGIQVWLDMYGSILPKDQQDAIKVKLRLVFLHANPLVCIYLSMQLNDPRFTVALLCISAFVLMTQCYVRAASLANFLTCTALTTTMGTALWSLRDGGWAGMYLLLQVWGGLMGFVLWGLKANRNLRDSEMQTAKDAVAETSMAETQTEDEGSRKKECRCVYQQLFLSARQPMLIVDLNIDAQKAEPHLLNPAARAVADGLRGDLFENIRLEHVDCLLAELIQSMRRRFDDHALSRDKAKLLPHGATSLAHKARPLAVFDITAASFNCDNDARRLGIVMMEVPKSKQQERQLLEHFKSSLICSLTNDLCTPMNSLLPLLKLMPSCISEESKEDMKEVAMGSAELLYSKIRDLTDYSLIELEEFHTEESDFFVEELFQEIKQIFQFEVNHKDNVLNDTVHLIGGRKLLVLADRQRLKQVLIKLVANANKYTWKGVISLEAAENQDNLDVEFTVRDSGMGMQADKLALIFASLKQKAHYLHEHNKGCTALPGFGLTIAKSLCESMGSQLSVTSTEGKGTTFVFTIPTCRLFGSLTPQQPQKASHNPVFPLRKLGCSFREKKTSNKEIGKYRSPHGELARMSQQQSSFEARGNLRRDSSERLRSRTNQTTPLPEVPLRPIKLLHNSGPKVGDVPSPEQREGELASGPSQGSRSLDKIHAEGTFSQSSVKAELSASVVLIVDDVYGNRFVLREMLQRLGISTMEVSDGNEAVDLVRSAILKEVKLNIKIILMDLSMPIMDGIQATREIRALEREHRVKSPIPIIAVTAHHDENDKESSMEAGMQGFVTKPVHVGMLKDLILKYVGPGKRPSPPSS